MAEEIANQQDLYVRKVRPMMDQATVVGLVFGFGIISAAFILGGSTRSFTNIPLVLIVIGSTLDNLTTIGLSISVALLTTFYGAVLANMVFLPLATKLERNSAEETLVSKIYLMGPTPVRHQANPRRLEMLLNSILPPSRRVHYFD